MQASISKYFGAKTAKVVAPVVVEQAQLVINLCDESDGNAPPTSNESMVNLNLELNHAKHSQFSSTISRVFGVDASNNTSQYEVGNSKSLKFTPLEQQVVDIRKDYPDTILIVECGYRMRFFGEDAVVAAKVLSIYAHMDHNFMVASIPTFRTVVHCRRLVTAGYKVAVVRQTETAALRKAGKASTTGTKSKATKAPSNGSSNTFARGVVGVFSPGATVEEFDPAFRELVQTSNASSSQDAENDGDSVDGNESGAEEEDGSTLDTTNEGSFSAPADENDNAEVWITSIYEERTESDTLPGKRVLAVASVDVRAHKVQCATFTTTEGGDATEQDISSYLDLLKPTEILYSDNVSESLVRLLSGLLRTTESTTSVAAAETVSPVQFLKRLAPLPVMEYLTSPLLDEVFASSLQQGKQLRSPTATGCEWVNGANITSECRCAVFGLAAYLKTLNLSRSLCDPAVEILNQGEAVAAPAEKQIEATVQPSKASTIASTCLPESFKLDAVTARDLEVLQCALSPGLAENNRHGGALEKKVLQKDKKTAQQDALRPKSLFDVINFCKSTYGRRTLRQWLLHPLCRLAPLQARQQAIRWLYQCSQSCNKSNSNAGSVWVRNLLNIYSTYADLESLLTSLQHARIFPKRLARLLSCAVAVVSAVHPAQSCYAGGIEDMPLIIHNALQKVKFVEVGAHARDFMAKLSAEAVTADAVTDVFLPAAEQEFPSLCAFRVELSRTETQLNAELINIRVLLKMPNLEYKSLRTGPVSSIEHLIEVPVAMSSRIPADWIRSNCTKTMDRYHSPAVLALQDRLYELRDEIKRAAREAWGQFVATVRDTLYAPLRGVLDALGEIDALMSLSRLCGLPGYVEPVYIDKDMAKTGMQCSEIVISEGRHPIVERYLERQGDQFIANDVHLRCDFEARSCQIVTGPNMGGKSSYVRMIALICLMGQIGAHVPAQHAQLCLFDRIFTRMGAGDDLAAGQSTFMSELHRTNYILQRASSRSLVVLDELGRGTATNDGLAIAQATLTYLMRTVGCATLFVTHFPQIADLAERCVEPESSCSAPGKDREEVKILSFPQGRAVNIHMSYMEEHSVHSDLPQVMFLYKAVEGPSRGSYGLNVARLAGVPDSVLALAARNAAWMRDRRAAAAEVGCAQADKSAADHNDAKSSHKRKAEEPLESDTWKQPSF